MKIPKDIAFEDIRRFTPEENQDDIDHTVSMLLFFVKEWNFKGPDGEVVELNEENLRKLKVEVIGQMQKHVISILPKTKDEEGEEDKKKDKPESVSSPKQ